MPDCGGIADGLLDGHATPAAVSAAPAPGRTVQHLFFSTGYREYKSGRAVQLENLQNKKIGLFTLT